jgi:hypothetical protein
MVSAKSSMGFLAIPLWLAAPTGSRADGVSAALCNFFDATEQAAIKKDKVLQYLKQ